MPTYQYACTECGYGFDAVQSFTDDALTECPQCGGRLRKVFGAVGIVFKGSGFYRTDSRDAGKVPAGADGKKDKVETASDAGSDRKPADAAKPAAKAEASSATTGATTSGSSSTSGAASSGGSSGSAA